MSFEGQRCNRGYDSQASTTARKYPDGSPRPASLYVIPSQVNTAQTDTTAQVKSAQTDTTAQVTTAQTDTIAYANLPTYHISICYKHILELSSNACHSMSME